MSVCFVSMYSWFIFSCRIVCGMHVWNNDNVRWRDDVQMMFIFKCIWYRYEYIRAWIKIDSYLFSSLCQLPFLPLSRATCLSVMRKPMHDNNMHTKINRHMYKQYRGDDCDDCDDDRFVSFLSSVLRPLSHFQCDRCCCSATADTDSNYWFRKGHNVNR